jgi:biopolymer transport protein ExbD
MASKKRVVPEINAGSMADIAFLLLIFFLVTTTMDVDKGLLVKLPPWTEEQSEEQDIKEKNIFVVLVNAQDQLLIESEYATLEDVRRLAKEFIDNNGDGTCAECRGLRDPASSDNPGKAVISLQNDRGTSYNMFVKVRNELLGAYSELRNELATRKYGRDYESLSEDDKEEVNAVYPQFISEAEPVQVGG